MTVLLGGLRVLGANAGRSTHGVFTKRRRDADERLLPQLLDMNRQWQQSAGSEACTRGATARRMRSNGPAPRVDLILVRTRSCAPSRKSMRAADSKEKFVADFVAAWAKVMDLDRFDIGERTAFRPPVAQAAE